ncbi:RNA-binding domain superfamily, partial [Arabidopsis thaliana x Arabidopsis arenosa]
MDPAAQHSAKMAGDGFAEHYYKTLQNSPKLLPRYYKDVSKITRPGLDGTMRSSTLQDMIEDLDMLSSSDFDTVEVTSLMSQESHSGGILVVADGYFTSQERPARNFTQNFFLAPQEKGYFVLTDMFKFVDFSEANDAITEGAAICVKKLPPDATITLVEDAFKQFGEIRRGGVEVRHKRSFSYGFVEFKEESAAQAAIEASPVMFDWRSVYVEKKRPDYISYWETPSSGPGIIYRSEEMSVTKDPGNN